MALMRIEKHPKTEALINVASKIYAALAMLLFTPWLIRAVGFEAYGVFSFLLTLIAVAALAELGLGTTINRINAASTYRSGQLPEANIRHYELISWILSFLVMCILFFLAEPVSRNWFLGSDLDETHLSSLILLIAPIASLQVPILLYSGALAGLHMQTSVNVVLVICTTLRYVVGVGVILKFPDLHAFFYWYIFTSLIQVIWLKIELSRQTSRSRGVGALAPQLRGNIKFSLGVGLTSILGAALTQLDKILLSKYLSAIDYAEYMVSWTLSGAILMISGPVVAAHFPRLVSSVDDSDEAQCQVVKSGFFLLSSLVSPLTVGLIAKPELAVSAWIGGGQTSSNIEIMITLLAFGSWLNTTVQFPHALQLAHGKARIGLLANVMMVTISVPALMWAIKSYSAIGACGVWVLVNLVYFLITVPYMVGAFQDRRLVIGIAAGGGIPVLVSIVVWVGALLLLPAAESRGLSFAFFAIPCILGTLFSLAVPVLRLKFQNRDR
jgi:O-antigen/teichoic acid export membrane protein